MSHKTSRGGLLAVATASGAVLAAALIPVATAPTARADTPIDQFQDMLIGEAPGGEGGSLDFSDLFTGEGTAFDQTVDSFYASVDRFLDMFIQGADPIIRLEPASAAVPADSPIDTFQDMLIGQAPGGEGGLIDFSDLFTGEGTAFDQLFDGFYAQMDQFLDMFIHAADPLMMF
jgi:hypothetical protein